MFTSPYTQYIHRGKHAASISWGGGGGAGGHSSTRWITHCQTAMRSGRGEHQHLGKKREFKLKTQLNRGSKL